MKKNEKLMYAGLMLTLASVLLVAYVEHFDDFTEISEAHDRVLDYCMYGALAIGLVTAVVAFFTSRGASIIRRVGLTAAFGFLGFLCTFMLSDSIATYVQGITDFPAARTKSFTCLWQISRAYQTHGKGNHWTIQTQPIWTNLNEQDYNFMLAHRRPDDQTASADEIKSKGYFCAKLDTQQSDSAVRILHAGTHVLPVGTVMLCPRSNQ